MVGLAETIPTGDLEPNQAADRAVVIPMGDLAKTIPTGDLALAPALVGG
jgi:hypothetical protein